MSDIRGLEAVGKIQFGATGELELIFRLPPHLCGDGAMDRLVEIMTNIMKAEKGWAYKISTDLRPSTQTAKKEVV